MAADRTEDERRTAMTDVQKAMKWAGFHTDDLREETVYTRIVVETAWSQTNVTSQGRGRVWRFRSSGTAGSMENPWTGGGAAKVARLSWDRHGEVVLSSMPATLQELKAQMSSSSTQSRRHRHHRLQVLQHHTRAKSS